MAEFLVLVVVFAPTIVAWRRHLRNITTCFWINLLLGWSIFFWLPLLIYVILSNSTKKQ